MKQIKVELQILSNAIDLPLPNYQTDGASGLDLIAAVETELILEEGKLALIPTGLKMAIPFGYEAQVRPRSGLALKHSIGVLNSPGTIDADYRGEIKVLLFNFGDKPFIIKRGMRIAQLVFAEVIKANWQIVNNLIETSRSEGGFGSTGIEMDLF